MKKKLILILLGVQCWAQPGRVAVGFPPAYQRYNDNTNINFMFGDTWHFSAITAAGNRFGTWNDGWVNSSSGFANVAIVKLVSYDVTSVNGTNLQLWSHPSFQAAYTLNTGTPLGCSVGASSNCAPKSYDPFCMAGHCYLNVFMQSGQSGWAFDSTLLRSDDLDSSPPHFCSSATLSGGACPSNATTLAGSPPDWNGGVTGIMFPGNTTNGNNLGRIIPILPANYQDDGSTCPVIPASMGGDDTGTYAYFYTEGGDFANLYGPYRVLCTDLPKLDASKWEAWTGSVWSGTLSNVAISGKLSPFYGNFGTLHASGTSPAITYLPDLKTIVMLGQVCWECSNGYVPDLILSQSTDIKGAWTIDPMSRRHPAIYQYATNPTDNKLTAAMTDTTGTSAAVSFNYDPAVEPPVPFVMRVDSEDMLVTAASANSRTVTRGYNGTAPATHAVNAQVISPYRLRPSLPAFVAGTYSYANGVVSIGLAVEGEARANTTNGNQKWSNVYGPYFGTMKFQMAPPSVGTTLLGNVPLRFSMGPSGLTGLPGRGLKMFWDFWQNAGAQASGIKTLWPEDLVTGQYCTPTQSAGYQGTQGWTSAGYNISYNVLGFDRRCIVSTPFPISGSHSRTLVLVVRQTAGFSSSPSFVNGFGDDGTPGKFFGMAVNSDGSPWLTFNGARIRSTLGGIANNAWVVYGWTYQSGLASPDTIASGSTIYLNGAVHCGIRGTACNDNSNPNTVINTTTTGWQFGASGTANPFANFVTGDYAGFGVWDRELSPMEMKQVCRVLQAAYNRAGRGISLTCN